tara:strand:- start:832 stop:2070 length:1239 start_codon:yes stop_codon:yes gene_type:complete
MGKRELKKQYPDLTVSLVDILGELDPTPTKKILPFLCKRMNDFIQYDPNQKGYFRDLDVDGLKPSNELDAMFIKVSTEWFKPKMKMVKEFVDHLQNNRLVDNDINNYHTWEDINMGISDAEVKSGIKTKRNKITELHRDDEWLVMKPLTIESSLSYGSGTKWCTASEGNPTYFHKYSRDGVLIYAINRKENIKYAFYSSPKEFSVWTAEDARIDSMESKIPFDLLLKIREWGDYDKYGRNYDHMSDEDKEQKVSKLRSLAIHPLITEEDVTGEPRELVEEGEMERPTWQDEIINEGDVSENPPFGAIYDEHTGYVEPMRNHHDNLLRRIEVEQQLVGLGDSIHGEISQNQERTWDNPYPEGPGGGFDMEFPEDESDCELPVGAVPANRETAEAMGVEFNSENEYISETPQRG